MNTGLICKVCICCLISVILLEVTTNSEKIDPIQFNNFYFKEVEDDLPALETIKNCDCPRVYLPVCGSNNRTYTNICKLHCAANFVRGHLEILYNGPCFQFIDPFEY